MIQIKQVEFHHKWFLTFFFYDVLGLSLFAFPVRARNLIENPRVFLFSEQNSAVFLHRSYIDCYPLEYLAMANHSPYFVA